MAKLEIEIPDEAVDRVAQGIMAETKIAVKGNKLGYIRFFLLRELANLAFSFKTIKEVKS